MSPLPRRDNEYEHLEIVRVPEREPERRRRQARPNAPPEPSDRPQHGRMLAQAITQAVEQTEANRSRQGIDPAQLLILQFHSINSDLRDGFERLQAIVVDERREKVGGQDRYRLLVQFPDENTRQNFQEELALYGTAATTTHALPQGLRRTFFDALQQVEQPTREDRIGTRLQTEGYPLIEPFYFDVDLWHPGTQDGVIRVEEYIRSLCQRYNGQMTESVRTASLLLAKIYGTQELAEVLLEQDLVARLDLPPRLSSVYSDIFSYSTPPTPNRLPTDDDPLACIIDSGVIAGHPLLRNWVVEEQDFDTGENTATDLNGHGTSVAGLVVYGDISRSIQNNDWTPRVKICSAKILRHDPNLNDAIFPDEHRIEKIIEDSIRYFVRERNCRIFNLSIGIKGQVYQGGRQFPLAEILDELIQELDIVIVVSAGNRPDPPIPQEPLTRDQFQQAVRDQLIEKEQRVCNPATAVLALTVGAIARNAALGSTQSTGGIRLRDAFAGSPENAPAPFTRTGPGYAIDEKKTGIKPDVVHYGGNYALQTIAGGTPRWATQHILLGEPTIQLERDGRFLGSRIGTSFACPHVTHAASVAATSLEVSLGRPPSANLIRALLGSATALPDCGNDWLIDEKTALSLVGYGMCVEEDVAWSQENRVRLISMDELEENKLHIYRVPVPEVFLSGRGRRGITISLAYDPPVRSSRKEYLARTMWFEAYQGLTTEQVEKYRAHFRGDAPPKIPSWAEIKQLRPPRTQIMWSTLQVRKREWKRPPKFRLSAEDDNPVIHLIVGCQQRFPTGLDPMQPYGLVVLFWHEEDRLELYQNLLRILGITRIRIDVAD